MTSMTKQLIYIPLNMRNFKHWAGRRGLIQRSVFDEGLALHILLSSVFGKSTLQPFRLFASDRRVSATLYAYADLDAAILKETAEITATPDCLEVINTRQILSKPMRSDFPNGLTLGFDVRIRPVRRLMNDLFDSQSGKTLTKGSEIDAFRVHVLRRFPNGWNKDSASSNHIEQSRSKVYIEWLIERLGDCTEIQLHNCRLARFQRNRISRNKGVSIEGPDACIQGSLTVKQSSEFAIKVCNGIGRHRAYGYGMIMLRPPNMKITR